MSLWLDSLPPSVSVSSMLPACLLYCSSKFASIHFLLWYPLFIPGDTSLLLFRHRGVVACHQLIVVLLTVMPLPSCTCCCLLPILNLLLLLCQSPLPSAILKPMLSLFLAPFRCLPFTPNINLYPHIVSNCLVISSYDSI